MKLSGCRRTLTVAKAAAVLAAALLAGCARQQPADLLLINGKVLTVDDQFSIKSVLAIRDGKIIAVGSADLAGKFKAHRTIDLKGRVLMPGFTDTHIHVFARSRRDVPLAQATSIAEIQSLVREKAKELGPGEWVTGYGWDEARFAEKRNIIGAEEAVTIQDAIRMYTARGPYLTWEEKTKGTLEAGKLADMIVLDTDPLTSPPEALLKTNVDMTIIGGKLVYDRARAQ